MRKEHNYSVDAYRFLIMLWIVLFHYTVRYNEIGVGEQIIYPYKFENGGIIGVKIFFLVSGYFMTKGICCRKDCGLKVYLKFLIQRYYRLWLPYSIACCIIYIWMLVFPLHGRTVTFGTFIIDLFFILHPGVDCVDGAHWFLSTLFASQLILGLLLLANQNMRKYVLYAVSAVIIICKLSNLPPLHVQRIIDGYYLFEITLGMNLFMAKSKDTKAIVLSVVGLLISAWCSLIFFVFIVLFLFCLFDYAPIPVGNASAILARIGNLSFYWYLVHQNIGYSLQSMFVPSGNTSFLWILLPTFSTLSLAFVIDKTCKLLSQIISRRFAL